MVCKGGIMQKGNSILVYLICLNIIGSFIPLSAMAGPIRRMVRHEMMKEEMQNKQKANKNKTDKTGKDASENKSDKTAKDSNENKSGSSTDNAKDKAVK